MGGGLLQLVAYGAQDVYLTGNPQITFFKVVYRRHTNFSIEAIQQTFNGTPGYGQRVTCQISRNGDLIHRVYLALDMSSNDKTLCPYFGLRVINYVEIEIGGQKIDKHYSHWMYIWNELSLPVSKRDGYNEMVGAAGGILTNMLYIPLEFWFCRNVGLALPLIALQYHEVKINLNFETAENCKGATDAPASNSFSASLWVDYIFLDTDERRRFAQLSHEYLIEQLQFTGQEAVTSTTIKPKLSFNHPCKELVWVAHSKSSTNTQTANNNWFNYTTTNDAISSTPPVSYDALKVALGNSAVSSKNPVVNAKLVLNGNDRFAQRNGSYFNLIQPFQHHENVPVNAGINVYSFALKPEDHQPSGTLNMSRIDTAVLNMDMNKGGTYSGYISAGNVNLFVYAVNYNVLRILSGMGGLAYSN
jgi:hypothetical protein